MIQKAQIFTDWGDLTPMTPSFTETHQEVTQDHEIFQTCIRRFIENYRLMIGLEPFWSIEVQIQCPHEMNESEASVIWHAEVWYACMYFRCDIPHDLLPRLVLHELFELQRWKTTDTSIELIHQLKSSSFAPPLPDHRPFWVKEGESIRLEEPQEKRSPHLVTISFLEQQLREKRNQEIEQQVSGFFGGTPRPSHMTQTESVLHTRTLEEIPSILVKGNIFS